ncbi:NAD(P)-binding protein [Streptomyces sp. A7024]|uniref:NAD(P)-binding protein n=1 Tax=Streptomyces coryli TaxID=1128680 RepID=A0A6G4UAM0_9ACTN|nr:FAD-dependent monooxygenase [Streptomyces coryli]NGN69279.1 NAD(P)-binding protein [Streptomyces coryli]
MNEPHAVVIGAGIGGLTAAAALHRAGWRVTVAERAASLEPVGAGLAVAPNGQRALDTLGLGDPVRDQAAWQGSGGLRTPGGRWLARTDTSAAAERFGGSIAMVHRATLIDLLAAQIPQGAVQLGVTANLIDPGAGDRQAAVELGGERVAADLVVAADGVNSAVRARLFPDHPGPAYAGFTAWRIVVPAPDMPFVPHETWGRGEMWGSQPLKDGRVYAYGTAGVPEGGRSPDGEKQELLRRFGSWHAPIPQLIAAAREDEVLRNDVRHLRTPLAAYHRGRTALIGDAAHAMPPSLGQGGNQALEDAVVLAHHIATGATPVPDALAAYTRDRLPRTQQIARRSAQAGRATTLRAAPAVTVRNALIAAVARLGPGLMLRSMDGIADWRPPGPGAGGGPYAASSRSDGTGG